MPLANLANAVLLSSYVDTFGARCLDGTPPRYWLQSAKQGSVNASKWIFDFEGGAWCESIEDCASRAYGYTCWLGSTRPECLERQAPGDGFPGIPYNDTMDFLDIPSCLGSRWCGGLMNNDPTKNELSYDWNKVMVEYCDGFSYASNNSTVTYVSFNGTDNLPLYFRGRANVDAMIADLSTHHGLSDATDVLISGNSAGGLATYWAADRLSAQLSPAKVWVAPDSGFFITDDSYTKWPNALRWLVEQGNLTDNGLNENCVAAMRQTGGDVVSCAFPQVVAQYITTPLFVMNGRFDPALTSISFGIGGSNSTAVNEIGKKVASLVGSTILNRKGNAAFITSCAQHCGQWAQDQQGPFADFNVTINGMQAIPALEQWMLQGENQTMLWFQDALYPCLTCCNGGDQ
jgi:O-palmitoleoyl-L-serine hydrolase